MIKVMVLLTANMTNMIPTKTATASFESTDDLRKLTRSSSVAMIVCTRLQWLRCLTLVPIV